MSDPRFRAPDVNQAIELWTLAERLQARMRRWQVSPVVGDAPRRRCRAHRVGLMEGERHMSMAYGARTSSRDALLVQKVTARTTMTCEHGTDNAHALSVPPFVKETIQMTLTNCF